MTTILVVMNHKQRVIWAAGFLDGEGHFGGGFTKGKRHSYIPVITANQCGDIQPLTILQDLFGGNISFINKSAKNPKWRDAHRWQINSAKSVRAALAELMPYLIAKQDQAKVLLELVETIGPKGYQSSVKQMADEVLLKRADLHKELRELKR